MGINFFLVNQNPNSVYNDVEFELYEYPTIIPNGKQIKKGDFLLFNLSKKEANKNGNINQRIFGIAEIEKIKNYINNNKEYAVATYCWKMKFSEPLTYDEIGGDPRNNIQNSINKINDQKLSKILKIIFEMET